MNLLETTMDVLASEVIQLDQESVMFGYAFTPLAVMLITVPEQEVCYVVVCKIIKLSKYKVI